MPFAICCPACKTKLHVPDTATGKMRCPRCSQLMIVPGPAAGVPQRPPPASTGAPLRTPLKPHPQRRFTAQTAARPVVPLLFAGVALPLAFGALPALIVLASGGLVVVIAGIGVAFGLAGCACALCCRGRGFGFNLAGAGVAGLALFVGLTIMSGRPDLQSPATVSEVGKMAKGPVPTRGAAVAGTPGKEEAAKTPTPPAAGKDAKNPHVKEVQPTPERKREAGGETKGPAEPAPDSLASLLTQLKNGNHEEKLSAARELGKRGKDAVGAARALCEVALDALPEVRTEALEALEKICPRLYQPVVTLLVDNSTVRF